MREKLIELLQCSPTDIMGNRGVGALADHLIASGVIIKSDCEDCASQTTRCIDKLQGEIAKLREAQQWIPVTERLPEDDYYVLRNTETGMYFRGKGVNRWGKHFNQATIYRVKGTAEHSIKEVAWHGEKAELVGIKIVEMPLPEPPKGE